MPAVDMYKRPLCLAASFTADPAAEAAAFWLNRLGLAEAVTLAPYGDVMALMLDPQSVFRAVAAARVLMLRWRDLGAGGPAHAMAEEVLAALSQLDDAAPLLLIDCPDPDNRETGLPLLHERLATKAAVTLVSGQEIFARYAISRPFDPFAEGDGHLPYTPEAMAALGAAIARWRACVLSPPVKLIAVDCDNTLWKGVVGEDGRDGIAMAQGALRLQERLTDAANAGKIICLLSKNEEADVEAVFANREDMALRRDLILATRINWQEKAANLRELADMFAVGDDSIVFIDDNPVECAAVRSAMPGVRVIEAPCEADDPLFADHLWLLDQGPVTGTDRTRLQSYRSAARRDAAAQAAPSLKVFHDSLDLQIDIRAAMNADIPRLSQMTLRTNQFNASLKREDEVAIRRSLTDDCQTLKVVSVADRFGDYGTVGALRAHAQAGCLVVDLFLLSCRALGRGVEHRMVNALAEIAERLSCDRIEIALTEGPRNTPVRAFLKSLGIPAAPPVVTLDPAIARSVRFDPDHAVRSEGTPVNRGQVNDGADPGAVYQEIAREVRDGPALLAAMRGPAQPRPALTSAFQAPAAGTQNRLAALVAEVLNLDSVGVDDPFLDLGARSIDLVRLRSLIIARTDHKPDLADLFRLTTVRTLARFLDESGGHATTIRGEAVRDRADRMRAARQRPKVRPARRPARV